MYSAVTQLTCYCHLSFSETPDDCPKDGKNWTASGVKCYHFVPEQAGAKAFTFEAAKEQCKGYGGPVRWSHTTLVNVCFVILLTSLYFSAFHRASAANHPRGESIYC